VEDVAARCVGQRVKDAVHRLLGRLIYNHWVVGYESHRSM
jgi:hypothetical protein